MITKAADIADVIKAFGALWRSSYAVAPSRSLPKRCQPALNMNLVYRPWHTGAPYYQRTRFRVEHFYEGR
jgi:hypothetical protein